MTDLVKFFLESADQALNEDFFEIWFKGEDHDTVDKLRTRLRQGYGSESEKTRDLESIDEAIDNANRIFTYNGPGDWAKGVGLAMITGSISEWIRLILRATNGSNRANFREALMDLRAEIKNAPVKKQRYH